MSDENNEFMAGENDEEVALVSKNDNLDLQQDIDEGDKDDIKENFIKVEDLPFDKRVEEAKKYFFLDTLRAGLYIDALDTVNSWCLAKVVELDERLVKVHYDGWPHKWDDWMKITSYKISPFRK